jgi:hypothetical protein
MDQQNSEDFLEQQKFWTLWTSKIWGIFVPTKIWELYGPAKIW